MPSSDSVESKPVVRRHWHHDVQEEWGRRRLYFALFQFDQLYPQDEVLDALKEMAADNDVSSYATYEVMGEWDLLGRLYAEPFRQRRLAKDIEKRLKRYHLQDQKWLEAEEVVRHWVWTDNGRQVGEPRRPLEADLRKAWPKQELRKLNDLEQLKGRQRPKLAREYMDADLLAFGKHQGGMKLAIAIERRGSTPDRYMYEDIKKRLALRLDEAGAWLRERSLYAFGRQSETTFLVMCRLDDDKAYGRIRFELLQPIGELVKEMQSRITTYPIVSNELVCFTDRLPSSLVQPSSSNIEELLEGPESLGFEAKGSAFTPLDAHLLKGKPAEEADGFCVKTIGKEVVGFLNNGGGCLVVGALETDKFGSSPALAECERNEHFVISGLLDETYRSQGWDAWERRLRDILRSNISPPPSTALDISSVKYRGKVLAVITIEEAEPDYFLCPTKDEETYWVREGTSAVKLEGADLERHRKRTRGKIRRNRRREEP